MNFYVITEGKSDGVVYKSWIPFLNPMLSPVNYVDEAKDNNFYIVSAEGYPFYLEAITGGIEDVNMYSQYDRLVVAVDSEDLSRQEKYAEILHHVSQMTCRIEVKIVVQHFCLEAWALGNRKIIRKNPQLYELRKYKKLFDVRHQDPELLPDKPDEALNRAQFAKRYLRFALNDKHRNLSYTVSNPVALCHPKYVKQLIRRQTDTGHISSFQDFIQAFS